MPGKEIAILGSGDIGLIMARRLTLEGAKVKVVAEIMPYSGGLKRNIVQCLDDFDIPLKLNHTVIDIKGRERVEAVTIAEVDKNRKPIPGTEEVYTCDTLLLSVGLIPENELSTKMGVELDPATNGPIVDESFETRAEGVFACGNVLHVHDLVDYVSEEAALAGQNAAKCVLSALAPKNPGERVFLKPGAGIAYTVPKTIDLNRAADSTTARFRVRDVYKNSSIKIYYDGKLVKTLKRLIMAPGEMESVKLQKSNLAGVKEILIQIEEEGLRE
jgi:pyruvate/2-oxoglutarate dehydrogenase complex dihydrolipoamide dehydrogenase (E3) component